MPSIDAPPIFLAPFPIDRFLSRHYDQQRLHIHRDNSAHFADFVSLEDIDTLVTSVRIPLANLNLAQGDTPLRSDLYCLGGNYVDKARVLALHEQGATIILRAVEQWSPKLNQLRIVAERFFGCNCQINAYITPPGKKSTPPHWDTHDLVVMQIAGSKQWRVFAGKRSLPLPDERFGIGQDEVSDDYETIVLQAGDTLYLPRGVIHEPVALSYSVHLSIGIHVVRWHDVFELMLRLLAEQEGSLLRTGMSFAAGSPTASPPLQDVCARLLQPDLLAQATDILRQRFVATRGTDLKGTMFDFDGFNTELTDATRAAPHDAPSYMGFY